MSNADKIIVHVDAELKPIVPRFIQLRHEDIESINKSLENDDFNTIQRIGHSMKGSGGGYGFDFISEIGKGIEDAAKAESAEEIKKRIEELSKYLKVVEVTYDE